MQREKQLIAAIMAGINGALCLGAGAAVLMPTGIAQAEVKDVTVAAGETLDLTGKEASYDNLTVAGTVKNGTIGNWANVSGSLENMTINKWGGVKLKAISDSDTPTATGTTIEGGTDEGCKGQLYLDWKGTAKTTTVGEHAQFILNGWNTYADGTTIKADGTMIVGSSDNVTAKAENIKNDGGTLQISGSGAVVNNVTLAAGSTVNIDDAAASAWLGGEWSFYDDLVLNSQISGNSTFTFKDTRGYHHLTLGTVDGNVTFNLNSDLANGYSDTVIINKLGKDVTSATTATVKFNDVGLTTGKDITGSAAFATAPEGLQFTAAEVESGAYTYKPTISATTTDGVSTWTLTTLTNITPQSSETTEKTAEEKAAEEAAAKAAAEKAAAEAQAAKEAAAKAAAEQAAQEAAAEAAAKAAAAQALAEKQQTFAASTTVKAANDQAAGMAVVFRGTLNNVERRLGDLRQAKGRAGAWARYYHAKEEAQTGGRTTHISSISVQVGWDRDVDVNSGRMFYGYALGYTDGSMGLYRGGGDYTARTAAAYGSWLGKHGHFSDIIFKYGWLSNDYHSVDTSLTDASASFDAQAFSLSAEYGRRITGGRGFFVEPQVEFTLGRVGQETWQTSNAVTVHSDTINSVLGRAGVEFGQQVKDAWNWYGRVSLVREFNAQTRVTASSSSLAPVTNTDDLQETYLEWSLGFNGRLSNRTNCYFEYMGTNGDKTKTCYQLNVGVRWNF